MNTKLTLDLDKSIVENAKAYAKSKKISLSELIESYLYALTIKKNNKFEISALVESLTGVIPEDSFKDDKTEYYEFLSEKYK